jgi:type I restriction enzyme S subunit
VKKGWQEKSVGDILQLEYGKPLDESDRKPNGRYPVYGANGEKDRTDKFYHDKPSIIVGRKGSAGEVNLTEKKFWPLDVTYFVTFDEKQHDLQFLYYLLTTLELTKLAKGVKPGINRNEVYSQTTRVPPLAEQQRIVGLLDEAFEGLATAKANAEKNLQNARALFESHLQSVFTQRGPGWVEKNLGDLCQIKTGKKDVNEGNPDGKYPFFTCAAAHTFSANYSFDTEALLVAGNGNVGQVSYYSGKFEAYQRTYVLFDFKDVTAKYLFRVLDKRLSATVSKQKLGNTMPYIKIGMLTDFVVPVPPPKEQELVAESLGAIAEETQRLARLYERKHAALEALKKSLLHQAFTGAL